MKIKNLLFYTALATSSAANAQLPYQNANLSAHERAVDLCGRLSLHEKSLLMRDASPAIDRLGIPQFQWWSEILHGVARNGFATVFPQAIGMAATWDDHMVYSVFDAAKDEALAKNNQARKSGQIKRYQCLSFWTPNINIFRDPRWGRGQETYGEDPYLTSCMGLAVVDGLQGQPYGKQTQLTDYTATTGKYLPLLACAKHFAVHSGPEWNRHYFDVQNLPERELWETYMPAFKSLVQDGNVREVMCAYQRIDGDPCCGNNKYLQQILRNEWKFNGLVVSDCGAIADFWKKGHHETDPDEKSATGRAVRAGTDVECGSTYHTLEEAVAAGLLTEEKVNESVVRLLENRFILGDFDSEELVPWKRIGPEVIASQAHRQLAKDVALKSMTLLQNRNNILPLAKSGMKIAVMGPNATDSVTLWANYNGFPLSTTTLLKGIQKKAGNVTYIPGAGYTRNEIQESFYSCFSCADGSKGMKATYWNNTKMHGEAVAEQTMREPIDQSNGGNTVFAPGVELNNFSAVYEGVFRPKTTEKLTAVLEADDMARLIVNGDTLLNNWKGRSKINYDKREINFEAGKEYNIRVEYVQTTGMAVCKFDIIKNKPATAESIAQQAKDADVVVFCGGISPKLEGEEMKVSDPGFKGGDRTSIELPQSQRDILALLHKMGKKVVMVNLSGSAIAMKPEAENADAILQAWYPGEAGGDAVADVLFGDYNPGGKLPVTFYASDNDLPDFLDYTMKGRTYRYFEGNALFPFGHGLSYTTFKLDKPTFKNGKLSVKVTNTGKRDGDEVIQVYVKNPKDVKGPKKSLRGFKRIHLKAGESTTVTIDMPQKSFEGWDESTNTIRFVPGQYDIMVGNSSADNCLQTISAKVK